MHIDPTDPQEEGSAEQVAIEASFYVYKQTLTATRKTYRAEVLIAMHYEGKLISKSQFRLVHFITDYVWDSALFRIEPNYELGNWLASVSSHDRDKGRTEGCMRLANIINAMLRAGLTDDHEFGFYIRLGLSDLIGGEDIWAAMCMLR